MNTTFEIGMTLAMLALWALAVLTTTQHQSPPMRPRPQAAVVQPAEPLDVVADAASGSGARFR